MSGNTAMLSADAGADAGADASRLDNLSEKEHNLASANALYNLSDLDHNLNSNMCRKLTIVLI